MIIIPFADILAPGNFKKIRDCLHDDGVIAYPTDTLYGLGCNFFSAAAMARLDTMKKRSDLPYSVAVADLAMLESLTTELPGIFRDRLQKLLPGKFTFLFKPNPVIDPRLLKNSGRIGIRIPGLPLLLKMISALGFPLVSTSVNLSGRPPLNDPQHIAREFPELDLLIDGGVLPLSLGSTLVDVTVSPPMIVRPGADLDRIMAIV
ncbi:MAG: threonylcarbamoyl-AMP synthase [Candidatus Aminicenantes bacterium]|nr:threonylcarbamoyl-AMP synthase [Candidatus Aminicenantes bacterium]